MARIVYLIDDDEGARKALALVLRSVQFEVMAMASAAEFLATFRPVSGEDRACLVTDLRMPTMSGLELQAELNRRSINVPIIVISAHSDIRQTVRAMRAGALSVLEKPVAEQELIDMINHALSVPAAQAGKRPNKTLEQHRERLTGRQREVFDLLMQGLQTKEVARRLNLSHRTIEVHRANILERLELSSFTHLLRQLLTGSDNL